MSMSEIALKAIGHWPSILAAAGIPESALRRKRHGPCPVCGGKDRYRFEDKDGRGTYYCNNTDHGPGDGFKLLIGVTGWGFHEAAKFVEEFLGGAGIKQSPVRDFPRQQKKETSEHDLRRLKRTWDAAKPVRNGDPVDLYLRNRGLVLPKYPAVLRYHSGLGYYESGDDDKPVKLGEHPAMLALVHNVHGKVVSIHRTYLTHDGHKAKVDTVRKMMTQGVSGGAIRLFKPGHRLALAEGIETALAVHLMRGLPVWATTSKSLLENIVLPDGLEELDVFADNDLPDKRGRRAGQEAAKALVERLNKDGKIRRVRLFTPAQGGTDFNDVYCGMLHKQVA